MKTLPAEINIARPSYSDGRKLITIQITDKKSGCGAVAIEIGYAEFAQALTGLGAVDCQMTFNDSGVIGKKYEYKQEVVKIPKTLLYTKSKQQQEALRACLECYETDGWIARDSDAMNHHHILEYRENDFMARVSFTRYIEED